MISIASSSITPFLDNFESSSSNYSFITGGPQTHTFCGFPSTALISLSINSGLHLSLPSTVILSLNSNVLMPFFLQKLSKPSMSSNATPCSLV